MEARPRKDGKVTYRLHPIGGKPINLGTDKHDAIRRVLDLSARSPDEGTVNKLWREYQESRQWADLAEPTQKDYLQCSGPLLAVFGDTPAVAIRASDVATYLDKRSARVRANREIALLSNLLAMGIRRGLLDANPCRQVRRNKEQPRTRAVQPDELVKFLGWAYQQGRSATVLAGMAEFCALAGNRRVEFLKMTWMQVSDDAVRLARAKQRGKEVWESIEITPAMANLLHRMRSLATNPKIGYVTP
uniref:Integrase n=1 Tax=mine drainage metagenome TaxID=410659 RepID=E6PMZ7_9ZZZZ